MTCKYEELFNIFKIEYMHENKITDENDSDLLKWKEDMWYMLSEMKNKNIKLPKKFQ